MASNTKRFGLLKKDPIADKNDTFNIQTMLNDNWDKLDSAAKKSELDAHANDTTVHITADERAAWNAKAEKSVATQTADGLMSKDDKTKLDGIAAGAEVNQNAFSNVKVGSTTVSANSKTDTLELVEGSNITITPDATNDKVTIAATVPVSSVNGKTGAVTISASDVNAYSKTETDSLLAPINDKLAEANRQTQTLEHGLSVLNGDVGAPVDVQIEGRTLVNLLGIDGNCETTSGYTAYPNTSLSIDSTSKKYGSGAIKITANVNATVGLYKFSKALLSATKYYLFVAELKNGNLANGLRLKVNFKQGYGVKYSNTVTRTNNFEVVYVKIQPSDFGGSVKDDMAIDVECSEALSGQYGYVDGIRLYEITSEEYNNIGTVWNDEEVARRYPYVDSVQHVQNPYVMAEGDNLIPPFTDNAWVIHANAVVKSPYELELNATGTYQQSKCAVSVKEGKTYTLTLESLTAGARWFYSYKDSNGKTITSNAITVLSITLTIPTGVKTLEIGLDNGTKTSGTYTFTNPMLTLGSTAKPFVPRNPSYLYVDGVKLGALADKKDILFKDNGDWKVLKWIEKSETLTITNNTATLANNTQADTAVIVDESTGEIYKRVVTLSGSGKEFTQGGSGNKTITFNSGYVPATPKAHYVLATPQTIVVTDKVEGDLVVNGATQVKVGSGFTYTETDGKRTYTLLTDSQRVSNTVNITDVTATYANNIRSALDDVAAKVSDNTHELTLHNFALDYIQALAENNAIDIDNLQTYVDSAPETMQRNLGIFNVSKSGKDSNGVFTTVDYKRSNGTLFARSVLSNADTNGNYKTRTITYYATDGTTVVRTDTWTLTYDADGDLVSEVKS